MSKRQRITLTTLDTTIAEWTTGATVETEQQFAQAWQVANDLAAVLGHQPQEKSYQAAGFVQAFCRSCYFCGGNVKPDGNGGYVCQACRRTQ